MVRQFYNHSMKKNKGFTLIELLVVIAVISILSSVVMTNFNSARAKARDTKRKAEMVSVQTALEAYYLDHGAYPVTSLSAVPDVWYGYNTGAPYNGCGINKGLSGPDGYIPNLAPQYIPVLPEDPSGSWGCWYGYLYSSNGKDYILLDSYGPESYPPIGSKFFDPCRELWGAWKVCNTDDKTSITSYCFW